MGSRVTANVTLACGAVTSRAAAPHLSRETSTGAASDPQAPWSICEIVVSAPSTSTTSNTIKHPERDDDPLPGPVPLPQFWHE